jgi:hypothetical protein
MVDTEQGQPTVSREALNSLSPKYDQGHHERYVELLQDALARPETRNIALSGGYGTGKSSVLNQLRELLGDKSITISLSSLGFEEKPALGETKNSAAISPTNLIQKEIVKQILYLEPPSLTPASRYVRPTRPDWRREFAFAALLGGVLAVVGYVTGLLETVRRLWSWSWHPSVFAVVTVALSIALILVAIRALTHDRFRIQSLTAGPATIALSPSTTSYFDEYLDEIVYYFEISGKSVLILEDIDRFENPHIFEALRLLNSAINNAGQVPQVVKFVYAIRDSIFQPRGSEADGDHVELEVAKANRTKFFDLIVPVVPFITNRNARDLTASEIESAEFDIDTRLVDLVGRHIVDMRLVTNIVNECRVFRTRLLEGKHRVPSMTDNALFALMVYKNTHLADFDLIRLGTSDLDTLYRAYRDFVSESVRLLNRSITEERQSLRDVSHLSTIVPLLNEALTDFIAEWRKRLGVADNRGWQVSRSGTPASESDLSSEQFWRELAESRSTLEIDLAVGQASRTITLSASDLERELRVSLDASHWQQDAERRIQLRLRGLEDDLRVVSYASMATLFTRSEFVVFRDVEGVAHSVTFAEVVRDTLKSRLAVSLIEFGYLDENYALFSSLYYGTAVSPRAMNFLLQAVDRGNADYLYKLLPDEVESILRERGSSVLADSGSFNLDITNHLILSKSEHLSVLIRQLGHWGEQEREFVSRYMHEGEHAGELIRRLAGVLVDVFELIVETDLDDTVRLDLFDQALKGARPRLRYTVSAGVRQYLEANYGHLPSLSTADGSAIPVLVEYFERLGVRIGSLKGLAPGLQIALADAGLFELTEENLESVLASEDTSLNAIRGNPRLYAHVLDRLEDFAKAKSKARMPILTAHGAEVDGILRDVGTRNPDGVELVLRGSERDCVVAALDALPLELWKPAVRSGHVRIDTRNVTLRTRDGPTRRGSSSLAGVSTSAIRSVDVSRV